MNRTMNNTTFSHRPNVTAFVVSTVLSALVMTVAPLHAASRTWTGAGANALWSTPGNWSPAGAPANGDTLTFSSTASRLVNTNDLPGLRAQSIVFNGPAGGVTLRGNVVLVNADITAVHSSGFDTIDFTVEFPTGGSIVAGQPGTLIINGNILVGGNGLDLLLFSLSFPNLIVSGAISGHCDVVKIGDGVARLNGPQPNTYSGTTFVKGGEVRLSKSGANRTAIPGPLVIGDNTISFAEVTDDFTGQFPTGINVTVSSNGTWNLTGGATVGHLTLIRGIVVGSGTLTLASDVDVFGSDAGFLNPRIDNPLNLGVQTRRFSVDFGERLFLNGSISGAGAAGITLDGGGEMFLESSNSYPGLTTIANGFVQAGVQHSLGVEGSPASGTLVQVFGALAVGGTGFDEHITLDGGLLDAPFIGGVELTGPLTVLRPSDVIVGESLVVNAGISGAGRLNYRGGGRLRLTGVAPNTLAGGISVNVSPGIPFPALLELAKPGGVQAVGGSLTVGRISTVHWFVDSQVNGAPVFVADGGFLDLGSHADSLGNVTFTGSGNVSNMNFMSVTGAVNVVTNLFGTTATVNMSGILSLPGNTTFNISNTVVEPAILLTGSIVGPGGFTKNGPGTMRIASAGSYSGPVTVGGGLLAAGSETALGATSAGTTVLDGGTLQVEISQALAEPLNLRGAGRGGTNGALFLFPATGVQAGIVLAANATVRNDFSFAILSGVISGPGGLTKTGDGTLQLGGSSGAPNTYAGDTIVQRGILVPFKGTGVTTIPGHLIIGTGAFNSPATVRHFSGFTILGSVTVDRGGLWDLNGQAEGWGLPELQGRPPLTLLNGGRVQTGTGIFFLPVGGDVVVNPGVLGASSSISGHIGLDPGPHRFIVSSGAAIFGGFPLEVSADISQTSTAADLVKEGFGAMHLTASNSLTGVVTVNNGTLVISNSFALGTKAGGTLVNNGASLALEGGIWVQEEPLTLNTTNAAALTSFGASSNTWSGNITLQRPAGISVPDSSGTLNILSFLGCCTGAIAGPGGLAKSGAGALLINGFGANSYAGTTTVNDGLLDAWRVQGRALPGNVLVTGSNSTLRTGRTGIANTALTPPANVTVQDGAQWLFTLNNTETIAGLRGDGIVDLGRVVFATNGNLTVDNTVSCEFSGSIIGRGTLNKRGTATLLLSGDSPGFTGAATVFDGTFAVNGRMTNAAVTVKTSSQLRGDGAVGNVTAVESDSVLRIDASFADHPERQTGDFEVGDLTMANGGVVAANIFGPSATGGNDLLMARGAVTLNNARLSSGFSYPPREGDVVMLLKKNSPGPISGNFSGFLEGTTRQIGDVTVRASYLGGDGNDFTLTVTNLPLAFSGFRLAEGNGNQSVEPDECNLLFVSLTNRRASSLTITSAVLRAVTDGVSLGPIAPPRALVTVNSARYPALPAGAARENGTPFQFRTLPTLPCGNPVSFELVLGVAGEGEFAVVFTLPGGNNCGHPTGGCESCFLVTGQFSANPPTLVRSLNFIGSPSICDPPKRCPETNSFTDLLAFPTLTHTFTNSTTNELCVTAQLRFGCPGAPTNALGAAAYLGTNDIHGPCVNYLGDTGSDGTQPFSFRVPPRTNFVILISARDTNVVCDRYTLELFGLPCPAPTLRLGRDITSGQALLQWSTASPGFSLQAANVLSSGGLTSFSNVTSAAVVLDGSYTITNATAQQRQFFRLSK
jgi:autotransporter-associated beta strand protein